MELSRSEDLFEPPYHPYTEALLSAIPLLDPDAQQERIRLEGDLPSPTDVHEGCPFESRCPRKIGGVCRTVKPPWQEGPQGMQIYCHIPIEELDTLQSQVFQFSMQWGEEL
jgi:peptide/nickel transport system ATP-binding protein